MGKQSATDFTGIEVKVAPVLTRSSATSPLIISHSESLASLDFNNQVLHIVGKTQALNTATTSIILTDGSNNESIFSQSMSSNDRISFEIIIIRTGATASNIAFRTGIYDDSAAADLAWSGWFYVANATIDVTDMSLTFTNVDVAPSSATFVMQVA